MIKHFPAGRHGLRAPLVMPEAQGWQVFGDGACGVIDASPATEWISEATSRVWCDLPKGSAAIEARGANWTVCDLTLLGYGSDGTGILASEPGPAFGGSWGNVHNVTISDFAEGVRIGRTINDTGNDNHDLQQVGFARCYAAIVLGARQAMHISGRRLNTRWCKSFVKVEGGGKLFIDGLDTDCAGTLLHTVGGPNDLAANNASYVFRNVTVDAGAGAQTLTLVNQEQPHWMRATFEDVWFPSGPYKMRASIKGPNSLLRLNRIENLPHDARILLQGGAQCVISDSVLPVSAAVLLDDASQGELRLSRCWVNGRFVSSLVARAT